jgi:hypothetical protein
MSKDINNLFLPEAPEPASEIDKKIIALRQRLATDVAAWPASANALLTDLAPSSDESEGDVMLALLVQDALNGVDVPRKYPEAYRRLLRNGRLRQTFLDLLAALDPNQAQEMPPLPKPDLSFLHTAVTPQPTIRQTSTGWQAAWQLVSDYLTRCFPPAPSLAYRASYDNLLEEQSIVLLENEFSVAGSLLNVLLEVTIDTENPATPTLVLSVAAFSGTEPPPLQAVLTWGSYQATAVLNTYGQAFFPPVAISTVLDESGQTINADLHLLLEPTPA